MRAGDRVAILSKNCPEFFELVFACAKIGAISVGLNWRLAAPEITAIVADASPTVVIYGAGEAALFDAEARAFESIRRTVTLGDVYTAWRDSANDLDPQYPSAPDDVVMLLYTSGTTGLPKGVMLTNLSLSFGPVISGTMWRVSQASVNLVAMPLFHIGGIGYGMSAFLHGGHTILLREVESTPILAAIERHGVTHAFFVPAVINMLVNSPGVSDTDFSTLELLVYGASPIGEALLRRAIEVFNCDFTQAYGMTETSGTVVGLPPADHHVEGPKAALLRACGRAFPWVQWRLVDPDGMRDVEVGQVGEIWLKTPQNTPGYWNKPQESAANITPEGWLRTGDAAFCDENGYLFLFDRFKDMIVSGAENIYPAEVENVLANHPAVREVAVIGVPHARWGETPKALVVLRSEMPLSEAALIDFARRSLARYKCPSSIEFVETLPRNAAGKLLKKDLRKPYWEGHARAVN